MIGYIAKILRDLIIVQAGDETLQAIYAKAGIPKNKIYHINEVTTDNEWRNFLHATLEVLNLTESEAEEIYADAFINDAKKRFPTWFEMAENSYDFICMQPAIHNSFAAGSLTKEARQKINDKFKLETLVNKVITQYSSENRLCGLYKSLARKVIDLYNDRAEIEEVQCMKNGSHQCEIHITWNVIDERPKSRVESETNH